ncbi:rhomboid-like protein [Streptomyces sp. ADI96-02]|uniref:rhomboid-like protein n=1 Tax=Streptomyces sp. ADI96-02 TaxID=1522760 RepID=UPI001F14E1B5|nr:rhomboid-like protein [Streptomyces sp. ADI96-02]
MPRKLPGSPGSPGGIPGRSPGRRPGRRRAGRRTVTAALLAVRRWIAAALLAARRWITGAPGTYVWLAVLFVTAFLLHRMSPAFEEEFLRRHSTNIHELSQDPLRVLVSSALWIDGGNWLPYAVLFTVFHATAEHWLGTLRWFAIVVAAHVLATLLSEGVLAWAIRHGHAPQSAVNSLDVGVSYALAGVIAVLVYRVPHPWRHVYAFAVLVVFGIPLATGRTFTDLGHFTAVLIGFACYPLTRTARGGTGTEHPAAQ